MKESGTVVERKGNEVKVELPVRSTCKRCSGHLHCRPGGTNRYVWAKDTTGSGIGDTVQVELEEGRAILLSFLLFIAPLLVLALVFALLRGLLRSDLLAALLGLAAVTLYFFALRATGTHRAFAVHVVKGL
jgi:positive regulator of sigma E activity